MAIKRYTCREHQGGIFTKEASRGRAPVRCRPEFPCDKADQPVKASAGTVSRENTYSAAEKRQAVSNVVREVPGVGKVAVVTQDAEGRRLEQRNGYAVVASKPRTMANDSLPLAMRAKAQLEAVGWVVRGRAWINNDLINLKNNDIPIHPHMAEVTASRGSETLVITWQDGVLVSQQYGMEHLKTSDNGIPPNDLHFNPDELTDSELVRMIKGMKVTWWNTLASSRETAIVVGNVTVEHIFFVNGDEDNSKRIVKFVDRDAGGFKAFHVAALMKVG